MDTPPAAAAPSASNEGAPARSVSFAVPPPPRPTAPVAAAQSAAAGAPDGSPTAASPRSIVRGYFGDTPWNTLHALPAFYVIGGSFLCVTALTHVLRYHVSTSEDHYIVFGFGAFTCFCAYFMIYHFLNEYSELPARHK